jgi:hypothetical protein
MRVTRSYQLQKRDFSSMSIEQIATMESIGRGIAKSTRFLPAASWRALGSNQQQPRPHMPWPECHTASNIWQHDKHAAEHDKSQCYFIVISIGSYSTLQQFGVCWISLQQSAGKSARCFIIETITCTLQQQLRGLDPAPSADPKPPQNDS